MHGRNGQQDCHKEGCHRYGSNGAPDLPCFFIVCVGGARSVNHAAEKRKQHAPGDGNHKHDARLPKEQHPSKDAEDAVIVSFVGGHSRRSSVINQFCSQAHPLWCFVLIFQFESDDQRHFSLSAAVTACACFQKIGNFKCFAMVVGIDFHITRFFFHHQVIPQIV